APAPDGQRRDTLVRGRVGHAARDVREAPGPEQHVDGREREVERETLRRDGGEQRLPALGGSVGTRQTRRIPPPSPGSLDSPTRRSSAPGSPSTPATRGSRVSAGFCAGSRWTRYPSSGTSCAATCR